MLLLIINELRLHQHNDADNAMRVIHELTPYVDRHENQIVADHQIRGLLLLAAAYRNLGDLDAARLRLEKAWRMTEKYRLRLLAVDCLLEQAWQERAGGAVTQAIETARRAEAMVHETGYLLRLPAAHGLA